LTGGLEFKDHLDRLDKVSARRLHGGLPKGAELTVAKEAI
jgi:hypothetical protein